MYDHVFSLCHVKEDGETPLVVSSLIGHSKVVTILLEAGTNFNHQDKVIDYSLEGGGNTQLCS